MPRLPLELDEEIIKILAASGGQEALKTCSLVCKAWLPLARKRIIYSLTIDGRWTFREFQHALGSVEMRSYVRTLRCIGLPSPRKIAMTAPTFFPSLKTLEFVGRAPGVAGLASDHINAQTLEELLQMLKPDGLYLRDVSLNYRRKNRKIPLPTPPITLRVLSLRGCIIDNSGRDGPFQRTFAWFLAQRIVSLDELQVDTNSFMMVPHMIAFINSHLANSITHLLLDCAYDPHHWVELVTSRLAGAPGIPWENLRQLKILTVSGVRMSTWTDFPVLPLLARASVPSLQEMRVSAMFDRIWTLNYNSLELKAVQWRQLDERLAALSMVNFEAFIVEVIEGKENPLPHDLSSLENALKRMLPSSNEYVVVQKAN